MSELIPSVWHHLIERHLGEATTWNINFPSSPDGVPEIRRTRLGLTTYRSCFIQRGDQYHFGLRDAHLDSDGDTDDATIKAGHVSATLLDLTDFGQSLQD